MTHPLGRWTAADIMQKEVVVVEPDDSLQEALTQMIEHHVTGLPVVDSQERCVGVVAASDILKHVDAHDFPDSPRVPSRQFFNPDRNRWEAVGLAPIADEEERGLRVRHVMTKDLIGVRPTSSVREAAQAMQRAQVHRLLVIDSERSLHGIISATDFVHLVAEGDDYVRY